MTNRKFRVQKIIQISLLLGFVALMSLLALVSVSSQERTIPPLSDADWHPTENWVAFGTFDHIAIFNENLQEITQLPFTQNDVISIPLVRWSPDGTMIAAIIYFQSGEGIDGRLIVWNVNQLIIRLDVVTGVANPLSWSGDSQFMAIGSIYNPGELNVYNVQNQQVVNTFDHTTDIYDIRWHPTNINQLGVGGIDRVFIINPFTSQEIVSLSDVSRQLTFSPDGSKLAATEKTQPAVFIFDTSTWTQVSSVPENMGYNEKALSWVTDSLIVVSGTLTVTKWNPITQQQLANFSLATEVSTFYFWKPDGSRLFLFGNYPDETIRVADANTGQVLVEYPPNPSPPSPWSTPTPTSTSARWITPSPNAPNSTSLPPTNEPPPTYIYASPVGAHGVRPI